MAHFPVNHPARPLYRVFAGLVGLYILVFGVYGVVETWGESLFDRGSHWALGLRTNLAFSLVSVIFGIILMIGASRRSNLGHYMNLTAGVVFMVTGVLMMSVLQTSANFLNFSMSTVIVSLLFGLLLLATGLYDKVGPDEHAAVEARHRRPTVSGNH
ncbi:DUF4383 domain-containing protein [Micromonospora mirobrigensis]|uniref:DUF4383 domain-containing protein n=1 Tax=Micromonospora mirobrigensis TaxID=262898 RepID=A0A1C4UW65_9ACTN|nr:DUF4383 domain-containing protein [Micromonospora mirobrigensis]SCE75946.1 protein of unknown function (DUF4383) [Micromonospora mirobrigensis]